MLNSSEFTEDMCAELVRDFITEYSVSGPTAQVATTVFLTIASSMPEEQASSEFQRAVQQSLAQSESWAAEFVQGMLAKTTGPYRETYQRALTAGQDPAAELVRTHQLPAPAAAEVVTLLSAEVTPAAPHPEEREQTRHQEPAGRPYLADIASPSGTIKVTVDPAVSAPTATVRTDDTTGPSADATARATVRLDGDRLIVRVPDIEGTGGITQVIRSGGRTTVYQSFGTVTGSVTGMRIDGNGTMYIGEASGTVASSPIEVLVTLPAGSGVKVDSHDAHLHVTGPLAALRVASHNGNVTAGVVSQVKIRGFNGTYAFDAVQGSLDIDSHNGHTTIGTYSGSDARLSTHNGSVNLAASPQARGRITARTHNGSITLRGVRGRQDFDVRTNTSRGSVTEL
ncbi:DUF4097 family beta strand repeat-containing protein [Streptomyces litmocidini]|uniref:hypothetical protein n=1 Tax=Streptomyces litmocidini TaxID=67318 RepID=UPI0036FD0ADA